MGTRHLIMVVADKKTKVAQYGQWDGSFESVGLDVARFLDKVNLDKFKKAVLECEFITDEYVEEKLVECGMPKGANGYNSEVADIFNAKFPELSRDTSRGVLDLILKGKARKLSNHEAFAADSLFCEYAYVIDLDKNVLELYQGFNKKPVPKTNRFHKLNKECAKKKEMGRDGKPMEVYYPVTLVKKIPLAVKPGRNAQAKLEKTLGLDSFLKRYQEFVETFNKEEEES